MKPLFVSQDVVIKRAYRRNSWFRLAGGVVILGLLLQLGLAYQAAQLFFEGNSLASQNRGLAFSINEANQTRVKYADLEKRLAELHSWGPILADRLPASAVLAAVEQTIPAGVVISRLSLTAVQQKVVKLSSGVFMVPKTYRLLLEGEQVQGSDSGLIERFSRALLAKMPSNSRQVSRQEGTEPKAQFAAFKLVLELPANGNYHGLGLSPVQQPENL
jgi:hypothetical protein